MTVSTFCLEIFLSFKKFYTRLHINVALAFCRTNYKIIENIVTFIYPIEYYLGSPSRARPKMAPIG